MSALIWMGLFFGAILFMAALTRALRTIAGLLGEDEDTVPERVVRENDRRSGRVEV